jgi:hypothetical protein
METINITTPRKSTGMQLTGNLLTGDTFQVKDYIKSYLDGKWDAEAKGWRVDTQKTLALLDKPGTWISRA